VSETALVPRDAATVMLVRDGAPRDDIDSRIEKTAADINLDSMNILGPTHDFVPLGDT